jgi:hypothetical protein
MQVGVQFALRNRLTAAASLELSSLLPLLQVFQLNAQPDTRTMLDGHPFSSRAAYSSLHEANSGSDYDLIWNSRAPNKVKIFAWLVQLDRLNTRANLHRQTIIDHDECPTCPSITEDRNHLFFECPSTLSA